MRAVGGLEGQSVHRTVWIYLMGPQAWRKYLPPWSALHTKARKVKIARTVRFDLMSGRSQRKHDEARS
ncbi:MAG: hypothetical protein NTNFB01_25910 [Nitrospira sp.]